MSDKRQQAHELIDRMPETQISARVGLLEIFVAPAFADLAFTIEPGSAP
jgi:hypothetical protein